MKKTLSVLLILTLLLSVTAMTAYAEEPTVVDSGKCGEDLTYTLDSEGTLTVSGTGKMDDWEWGGESAPWYHRDHPVKTVVIESGVTSIGECAFLGYSSLADITIPESVTSIGTYAFCGCYSLTDIAIHDHVTNIGYKVFFGCSKLSFTTYGGAKYLGNPDSPYAALIEAESTSITSCTVADGTKVIAEYAFGDCLLLESITFADSVTSISGRAFMNCSSLESVTLPAGLASIGESVFNACASLKSIELPAGLTSIGACAFWNCPSLESIGIPAAVTDIGEYAFGLCRSLTSFILPASVETMGTSVFYGCSGLTGIYCRADSQPSGWDTFWNSGCSAPVHWAFSADSVDPSSLGSTLSEGSLTVIVGAVCLAVGFVAAMLIFKKKKTEGNED